MVRHLSRRAIERFLRESEDLPLSYGPIGLVETTAVGFDIDEVVVTIGRGMADFDRAKAALLEWKQFGIGWVEIFPPAAPLEAGTVVAVAVRHLGLWSLNGCRLVYTISDGNRFGFAYGTLTNHAESGEEVFEVFLDPHSDQVMYRIRAASRPRAIMARLGYAYARSIQARFQRDSTAAMKRAIVRGAEPALLLPRETHLRE